MITLDNVKLQLIEGLSLEDMNANAIDNDAPLFNEGLGLDSVDAIELVVILDNAYGLKFKDMEEAKTVFTSIRTLTEYINIHAK